MHSYDIGGQVNWVDYGGQPINSYLKSQLDEWNLITEKRGLLLARGPSGNGPAQDSSQLMTMFLTRNLDTHSIYDDNIYVVCQKDPHVVPNPAGEFVYTYFLCATVIFLCAFFDSRLMRTLPNFN